MASLWDRYAYMIEAVKCDWCGEKEDLYQYDIDTVCRKCLENNEDDESEELTPSERNSGSF